MKKPKLTQWFEAKISPSRSGWYEVKCTNCDVRFDRSLSDDRVEGMRYYDCKKGWRMTSSGSSSNVGKLSWCADFWRGLASDPKVKK